jgi:hypothetical protein
MEQTEEGEARAWPTWNVIKWAKMAAEKFE